MAKVSDPLTQGGIAVIYLLGDMSEFHGVSTAVDHDTCTQSSHKRCSAPEWYWLPRKPMMLPRSICRARSRAAHSAYTAGKDPREKRHNLKSCPCMFLSKDDPVFRLWKQTVLFCSVNISFQTLCRHNLNWIFWTVKYLESQSLITFYPEIKTGCTAKAEFQNTSLGRTCVSLGNGPLCRLGKKGKPPYLFWEVCPLLLGKA